MAAAAIRHLAWELPYAAGAALKRGKKKKSYPVMKCQLLLLSKLKFVTSMVLRTLSLLIPTTTLEVL